MYAYILRQPVTNVNTRVYITWAVSTFRVSGKKQLAKALGAALSFGALAALVSPLAHASDNASDNGWYIGGNLGQSRANIDNSRIRSGLQAEGFATSSLSDHNHDTGFKLFGGYQFNPNFALESGYFNLGKFSYSATTVPPGSLNANIGVQGWDLDAVGMLPITRKFSAFGRAGIIYADARDSFSGTGPLYASTTSLSKRATGYKYGLGVQYAFNDAVAVRGEAERYRISDAVGNKGDIDLISVGLVYRFGGGSADAVDAPPAPIVASDNNAPDVAPIPSPAPAPATKPIVKLVTLDDTYFRFGKARLALSNGV